MATQKTPPVRITERLWSAEVGIAEAETIVRPREPAYVFSNGRVFDDKKDPYAPSPETGP